MALIVLLIVFLVGIVQSEQSEESCGHYVESGADLHETEADLEAPYFEDLWGYKVAWRLKEDGWNDRKRRQMLNLDKRNRIQPQFVPAFTELGYKKMKIPQQLYDFIREQRVDFPTKTEDCGDAPHQNCAAIVGSERRVKNNVQLLGLRSPDIVRAAVFKELRGALEQWSGVELVPTQMYGIRRYLNGSWLSLHLDTVHTHVVSVILQIDQDVDDDWPLYLIDNHGQSERLTLKAGEMLLYESARVPHGRMEPLNGRRFDNLFAHFKPAKKWYESDFVDEVFSKGEDASRLREKVEDILKMIHINHSF